MSEGWPWVWLCSSASPFDPIFMIFSVVCVHFPTARGKEASVPASNGASSGTPAENHHDQEKEREKEKAREEKKLARKSKKEKEALKSPVEALPPPGPLVALGRPKDKVKRPRCVQRSSNCSHSFCRSRHFLFLFVFPIVCVQFACWCIEFAICPTYCHCCGDENYYGFSSHAYTCNRRLGGG